VNLPGESSSVVTCLDGYQMARRGRAGAALSIAAVGSLIAGCVGTLVLAAFAPALAAVGDRFVSPEYCALMLFGLVAAVVLAHGSAIKAVGMVCLGLLFGIAGTDTQSGALRYTFGIDLLHDGVDFIPVAMGLFGIAEIMRNLDRSAVERTVRYAVGSLWPSREEVRKAWPAVLRGTGLGAVLGILPGGGAVLIVRGLRAGEAHGAGPRALRPGRGGGRRRPGIRQ
jgi:TctA family transporter